MLIPGIKQKKKYLDLKEVNKMEIVATKVITPEEGASACSCPECGSYNIRVDDRDGECNEEWEEIECEDCGLNYRAVYTLKHIEIDIWSGEAK